jgi:hypothetical protein
MGSQLRLAATKFPCKRQEPGIRRYNGVGGTKLETRPNWKLIGELQHAKRFGRLSRPGFGGGFDLTRVERSCVSGILRRSARRK